MHNKVFYITMMAKYPQWHEPSREKESYMKGDMVIYNGKVYVSDIDFNVFQPDIYGWTESVED